MLVRHSWKNQIKQTLGSFFFRYKTESIQNKVESPFSSMRDINNNCNSTRSFTDCDHCTPLGPLANLAHLLVEFVKGAYPIFPALVIYYQSHYLSLAVLTFIMTLGLIVYLQLRMINRDWSLPIFCLFWICRVSHTGYRFPICIRPRWDVHF